jgi:thiol-disulfide isomerase/thioredoxin
MKRTILKSLLLAALYGVLLCGSHPFVIGQTGADPKQPLVRLEGLDHKFYDVAEMRGSVVLVSFGATWCTPCSGELFALEALKKEYQGKPVKFFWVTIENEAQINDAGLKRYAAQHRLSFPVLRDPTRTAFLQFVTHVKLPMIVFYDKDGHFSGPAQFGMSSDANTYKARMRTRLDELLSQASTP